MACKKMQTKANFGGIRSRPTSHNAPSLNLKLPCSRSSPPGPFDAIVVGSGATGGWAAKELTEAGMSVALLEAGTKITPRDFTEHQQSWQLPYLGHSPRIMLENGPSRASATPAANTTTNGSSTISRILTRKPSRSTGFACACSADAR